MANAHLYWHLSFKLGWLSLSTILNIFLLFLMNFIVPIFFEKFDLRKQNKYCFGPLH